jgi:DNA polymerase
VTNAVKHFKWEPRGKRRLHAKPTYHPSALLRVASDEAAYAAMKRELEADLGLVASLVSLRRATGSGR